MVEDEEVCIILSSGQCDMVRSLSIQQLSMVLKKKGFSEDEYKTLVGKLLRLLFFVL